MTKRKVIYDSKNKMFMIKIPVERIEIHYMHYGVDILGDVTHNINIICEGWNKPTKKKICFSIYKDYTDIREIIPYINGGYSIDINEEKICEIVDCYKTRQKYLKRGLF